MVVFTLCMYLNVNLIQFFWQAVNDRSDPPIGGNCYNLEWRGFVAYDPPNGPLKIGEPIPEERITQSLFFLIYKVYYYSLFS